MNARQEAPNIRMKVKPLMITLRMRVRISNGAVERNLDKFFDELRRKRGKHAEEKKVHIHS